MPTEPAPAPKWPQLLTIADYARACTVAMGNGKDVTRQAINQRLNSGTLTATEQEVGGKVRRYIDTVVHPPGPATYGGKRPPNSVPRPKRPKA